MMYLDEIARQIAAELDSGQLPDEGDVDRLLRAYAVLVCSKGNEATLQDVHDTWAAWMAEIDPRHPALRPYGELDQETRNEDAPFLNAVRVVAARRKSSR
jgi:hypothetical protein